MVILLVLLSISSQTQPLVDAWCSNVLTTSHLEGRAYEDTLKRESHRLAKIIGHSQAQVSQYCRSLYPHAKTLPRDYIAATMPFPISSLTTIGRLCDTAKEIPLAEFNSFASARFNSTQASWLVHYCYTRNGDVQ